MLNPKQRLNVSNFLVAPCLTCVYLIFWVLYLDKCCNSDFVDQFSKFAISTNIWPYQYLFISIYNCLSVCLSVSLPVCLPACLSVCMSVCLYVCVCLSIYLFIVYQSIYLSIYLSIDLSIYLSIYLSICLSIYLICLCISILVIDCNSYWRQLEGWRQLISLWGSLST